MRPRGRGVVGRDYADLQALWWAILGSKTCLALFSGVLPHASCAQLL
jgi:hypothetical protein